MPVTPTYPGVYIQELPSPVHPITGVATSITAFVGYAQRGPVGEPTLVQSFAEFVRTFGGLSVQSTMSYAVSQFYDNGGGQALIVRAANTSWTKGSFTAGSLNLDAANEGAWSEDLLVRIDLNSKDPSSFYNLWVKDTGTGAVEVVRNLPLDASASALVARGSSLVRISGSAPTTLPTAPATPDDKLAAGADPFPAGGLGTLYTAFTPGVDGTQSDADLIPASDDGTGIYTLARADLFNLLCVPSSDPATPLGATDLGHAAKFCADHRALLLVDPDPGWGTPAAAVAGVATLTASIADKPNAALYFPLLQAPDPLASNALTDYPPCGAVAGVMARTDASRGVWKAPAGIEASIGGFQQLKLKLTDGENGTLNPIGVNCLRTFPAAGTVVWGARTLDGADVQASQWKYVPVRRTALFIEESLYRGTRWVVFEPNDEPLWAQIRLNVGAFMHDLFRKGAFQGTTPKEAYLVKCDKETTTQTDINNGVVNIVVGFAPLKPAEFVIIQIQQLAGQIET